jgi:hypothetical protein
MKKQIPPGTVARARKLCPKPTIALFSRITYDGRSAIVSAYTTEVQE